MGVFPEVVPERIWTRGACPVQTNARIDASRTCQELDQGYPDVGYHSFVQVWCQSLEKEVHHVAEQNRTRASARSTCFRFAEQAFKQAIEANPLFAEAWNGLGMVSTYPLIRQHCWVRSVQLAHNPSAWANLGMLYLRWGLDVQVRDQTYGGPCSGSACLVLSCRLSKYQLPLLPL